MAKIKKTRALKVWIGLLVSVPVGLVVTEKVRFKAADSAVKEEFARLLALKIPIAPEASKEPASENGALTYLEAIKLKSAIGVTRPVMMGKIDPLYDGRLRSFMISQEPVMAHR